jgi:protein-disulfide isomerase
MFGDFQCPYCLGAQSILRRVRERLGDRLVFGFRHLPIPERHPLAPLAAEASEAAAAQGKFWEFHDALYANQPAEGSNGLTNAKLIEIGKAVGLTSSTFVDAVNKQTYDAWVANVTNQFAQRGFNGTPTIVVNGKVLQGPNQTVPSSQLLTQTIVAAAG